MIEKVVETWHRFLAGELPEALRGLLADDVVFSDDEHLSAAI